MAYIRKTRDYWSIQQYTGREYGWEEVTAEDTWREARARLKEYRENQPEYPVRARRKRERIAPTPTRLIECGCCGCYHPEGPLLPGGSANYLNDCRNDANRFNSAEEYEERTGKPAVEVWLDEQELDLAI